MVIALVAIVAIAIGSQSDKPSADAPGEAEKSDALPAPPPPINYFDQCDSDEAIESVKKTFADGPSSKILGLSIIDVQDPRTVSDTSSEKKCEATAVFNNDTKQTIIYRFDDENGKTFVHLQLEQNTPDQPD